MKVKHWIVLGVLLIGALFILHNFQSHGGVSGVKHGLGFGGYQ